MQHFFSALVLVAALLGGASVASADSRPVWKSIGAGCTIDPAAIRNDLVSVGPAVTFKGSATGTIKLWCPVTAVEPAVSVFEIPQLVAFVASGFTRAYVTYKDNDGIAIGAVVQVCLRQLSTATGAVQTLGCIDSTYQQHNLGLVTHTFAISSQAPNAPDNVWFAFNGTTYFEVTLTRTHTSANVDFHALSLFRDD